MSESRPSAARRIADRQRVCRLLFGVWTNRGRRQKFLIAAFAHLIGNRCLHHCKANVELSRLNVALPRLHWRPPSIDLHGL